MSHLMSVADVARALGLTPAAVKTHDRKLAPERTENGRRVYSRDAVEAFRDARRSKKKAR
jgi:DNA-binding transcriptional MerR regulator